jgi:hypothetical protein
MRTIEKSVSANCLTAMISPTPDEQYSFEVPGTISVFNSGKVNISQEGSKAYVQLTVNDLETLLAQAKAQFTAISDRVAFDEPFDDNTPSLCDQALAMRLNHNDEDDVSILQQHDGYYQLRLTGTVTIETPWGDLLSGETLLAAVEDGMCHYDALIAWLQGAADPSFTNFRALTAPMLYWVDRHAVEASQPFNALSADPMINVQHISSPLHSPEGIHWSDAAKCLYFDGDRLEDIDVAMQLVSHNEETVLLTDGDWVLSLVGAFSLETEDGHTLYNEQIGEAIKEGKFTRDDLLSLLSTDRTPTAAMAVFVEVIPPWFEWKNKVTEASPGLPPVELFQAPIDNRQQRLVAQGGVA